MTVKRYDPTYRPYSRGMLEDNQGNYVKYSDYEKLESQNKELIENNKSLLHFNQRMSRVWDDALILVDQLNSMIKKLQENEQ